MQQSKRLQGTAVTLALSKACAPSTRTTMALSARRLGLTLPLALACCGGGVGGTSNAGDGSSTTGITSGGLSSSGTSGTSGTETSSGSSSSGGSSGTASNGSTSGGTGGFVTAPHNELPQFPNLGEPSIASPAVVTINYAGYPYDVEGYVNQLVGSDWLSTVGADYGVGLGQLLSSIVLDGGASGGPTTVTDAQIVSLLTTLVGDGSVPTPTQDTIYVVAYAQTTTVCVSSFCGCGYFGGYHRSFLLTDGKRVVYCVIATCPTPGENTDQDVHNTISHELIEAATDEVFEAGYAIIDPQNPWSYAYGGGPEVADVCQLAPPYQDPDGGLTATRVWSNTSARAGSSPPCVPSVAGETYYSVSVNPATTVVVDGGVPYDQTVTFTLTGWSTASMPDWRVWLAATPSINPRLNGGPDPISINNGGVATLTVTIPAGTASGSFASIELDSYLNDASVYGNAAMAAVYVR